MATATQTQPNGATIHEMASETVEAVITSGLLRNKVVNLTMAPNGTLQVNEPELTPEEMNVLEAVVEASKKAEATAIRVGQTARRLSEELRRSTAELRGEAV